MEWTREKTLNLINEYRKRPGLWEMTHDDYRKKEVKQKLLVEVASSLGESIPVVEIEKKFHTLRTQYHREINRMKRKEPYNTKWFGFQNLQFLSSPKACRMNKGRVKSEITEDGTVTKYVIHDMTSCHATSSGGPAGCSGNNINEEFVTIQRKVNRPSGTTITYDNPNSPTAAANSRSRELEKLIEETTKDVDEVEEIKPKISTIKQITLPLEHHSYSATVNSTGEMSVTEQQTSMHQQQHHQQESLHHHQQQMDEEHVETIDIQTATDDISYQASNSPGGGNTSNAAVHHQTIPTRIIKIQRRDTCQEEDYYNEDDEQQEQEQPGHHSLHTLSTNANGKHRIYYESNGQQHTATILATPTITTPTASSTLLNSGAIKLQRNSSGGSQQLQLQQQQQCRDEFSTYGEYVANEMRGISNREILIALKHKINTALFEASMAEVQK